MDNLIVCEFCGTTYDPHDGCCPICQGQPTGTDNYMGDHFDYDERPLEEEEQAEPRHIGRKIAALAALVALLIGFTGYILYSFELLPFLKPTTTVKEAELVPCTALAIDASELSLTELGQSVQLHTSVLPANTSDRVIFSSDHPATISVTQEGIVTAKGEGSGCITVLCGEYMAYCNVTCDFSEPEPEPEVQPEPEATPEPEPQPTDAQKLAISAEDISFFEATESTTLTLTGGDGSDPVWESANSNIATVDEDGHVVAVAKGNTTITATVGEEKATCTVRCQFE